MLPAGLLFLIVRFNPIRAWPLFHVVCLEEGGGKGKGEDLATLEFCPLDTSNRNQTLHAVGHNFEEFIC